MLPSETGVCSICEYPFENDYERKEHPLYKDTDICLKCYNAYYKDCDNNIYKYKERRKPKDNLFKVTRGEKVTKVKLI